MADLTHLGADGSAHMVDVSAKADTAREAIAEGRITMSAEALDAVRDGNIKKGDVLGTARIAGIMAAKKTSELIPLCHPLMLSKIAIAFEFEDHGIRAEARVRLNGPTGVEMEALTAVSVALLTFYDMAKALDKAMVISDIRLLSKTGGKSGDWHA
ncbi:MAG: cyclic pyranopterin monophosphate synthase MoaC [Sphingomonadaceae bacterium PASS1]|jgi:cyclic pyranopterin phosphate synthase|nr:MAG: cyclic pyranopterin monophosphate synthase MoaC [Sphingomonadaceae bacterium PASS1]